MSWSLPGLVHHSGLCTSEWKKNPLSSSHSLFNRGNGIELFYIIIFWEKKRNFLCNVMKRQGSNTITVPFRLKWLCISHKARGSLSLLLQIAPIWFGGPNLKQGVGRTEVIVPKNWCFVQCVKPRNGCMTTTLQTWQMTQSLQVFCQNSACANKRKLRMSCKGIFCHKAAFGLLGLIFFRASSSATHPKKVKTYKKKTGYTRVKGYIM